MNDRRDRVAAVENAALATLRPADHLIAAAHKELGDDEAWSQYVAENRTISYYRAYTVKGTTADYLGRQKTVLRAYDKIDALMAEVAKKVPAKNRPWADQQIAEFRQNRVKLEALYANEGAPPPPAAPRSRLHLVEVGNE